VTKICKKPWTWTDSFDKRPKRKKMDMRFGTRFVRSMYGAGSLRAVVEEISKYRLDLVGVQKVRWGGGGTESADEYFLILGGGVCIGSTRHVGHYWPILPAPSDCDDGEFGGMKIGNGNRSTRRKPAPVPLCSPQIPLGRSRLKPGPPQWEASN
jgi:hypothetical protein